MMKVMREIVPPKRLDTASCAPALLVAKTDITVSIAKPIVINLFDFIILIIPVGGINLS